MLASNLGAGNKKGAYVDFCGWQKKKAHKGKPEKRYTESPREQHQKKGTMELGARNLCHQAFREGRVRQTSLSLHRVSAVQRPIPDGFFRRFEIEMWRQNKSIFADAFFPPPLFFEIACMFCIAWHVPGLIE